MLTLSEITDLTNLLSTGAIDRGTFYMKIFQATTDSQDTPAETAISAALFQTQISMFSGWLGGIALAANYIMTDGAKNTSSTTLGASGYSDYVYDETNEVYVNEIYTISQQVALDFGAAVQADIGINNGDGNLTVVSGIAAAQGTWAGATVANEVGSGMSQLFPGVYIAALIENLQDPVFLASLLLAPSKLLQLMDLPNLTATGNQASFGGTFGAFMFGKSVSDFVGLTNRTLPDGQPVTYKINQVNGVQYVIEVKLNPDGSYPSGLSLNPTIDDAYNNGSAMKIVAVEHPLYSFTGPLTQALSMFWPKNWEEIREWEPLKEFRIQLEESSASRASGNATYTDIEAFFDAKYSEISDALGGFWGALELQFDVNAGALRNSFYQFDRIVDTSLSVEDEALYGGRGNDTLNGGAGNDTFDGGIGSDTYNGGAGTDTLDYTDVYFTPLLEGTILQYGLNVSVNSVGDGSAASRIVIGKNDLFESMETFLGSKFDDKFTYTGGMDKSKTLTFNGGEGGDEFFIEDTGNIVVKGDEGYVSTTPPQSPHWPSYTNFGDDVLDLTDFNGGLTLRNGGGTYQNNTFSGGDSSQVIVTFAGEGTLTGTGIEEVKLGTGNDTLITGNGPSIMGGTAGLHTKFDMGDGDGVDTVEIWGHALLKDGTIYASNGAEIVGFEKIDISAPRAIFQVQNQSFFTQELGYTYINTSGALNLLDYSTYESALEINLVGDGGNVSERSGEADEEDTLEGYLSIAGTDKGDKITTDNATFGVFYLGKGNDTIEGNGGDFVYTGGIDTFTGQYFTIDINIPIAQSRVSVAHGAQQEIGRTQDKITYAKDIIVTIADDPETPENDSGQIILKNALVSDYFILNNTTVQYMLSTVVVIQSAGRVDLLQEGAAQVPYPLPPGVYVGAVPPSVKPTLDAVLPTLGTAEDDYYTGSFNDDIYDGGNGNDSISGGFGNDKLWGGDGHDYINGGAGNDTLTGGLGDDILMGGTGDDTLEGGPGSDVLVGGSGKDTFIINQGSGYDIIYDYSKADGDVIKLNFVGARDKLESLRQGDDLILTFDGNAMQGPQSVRINGFYLQHPFNYYSSTVLRSITAYFVDEDPELFFDEAGNLVSNPTVTESDDYIAGANTTDIIAGLGGNDLVYGLDGNDTLDGGAGADRVYGGSGDDLIQGALDAAADVYDGGAGFDTVNYAHATAALNISFDAAGGVAISSQIGTDTLTEIENVITGEGNDIVTVVAGAVPLTVTYVGSDDIYNLSSDADVETAFLEGILPGDVTVDNIVVDGEGGVTEVDLIIAGQGTIALRGDDLSGKVLKFADGSQRTVDAAGLVNVLTGTAGADTLVQSGAYRGYNGLDGDDTFDLGALSSDTEIILHSGHGTITGGAIGVNHIKSVERIITGTGDDIATISGSSGLVYTGGDDIYTISGDTSETRIALLASIDPDDVTVSSFTALYGAVTRVVFAIVGAGTLTLQGEDLAGMVLTVLGGADGYKITPDGVEPPTTLFGTEEDDVLVLAPEATGVEALGGNDVIVSNGASTTYSGGAGYDTLDMSQISAPMTISLSNLVGTVTVHGGTNITAAVTGIEKIITGTGGTGVYVSGPNDFSVVLSGGSNYVETGSGNDVIALGLAAGYDYVDGGFGVDTVDYSATTQGIIINLYAGVALGAEIDEDVLLNIEGVIGGAGNDDIIASLSSGTLQGGAGNDTYTIDATQPPANPFNNPYLYTVQKIIDSEGYNVINIIMPGDESFMSYSINSAGDAHFNIYENDYQPTSPHNFVLTNLFGANPSHLPVFEINLIYPEYTWVHSAEMIKDMFGPWAANDSFNAESLLTVAGNVLANNGSGADYSMAGPMTVTAGTFTTTNGATVVMQANGDFTYTGATAYSGSDSFTYTITSAYSNLTDTGTVSISNVYDQPNRAPTAVADLMDAGNTSRAHGNVIANDSDLDNNAITALAQTVTTQYGGTVRIFSNGDVIYQAAAGFRGDDSFEYVVIDSHGAQTTGSAIVENVFSNAQPKALNDSVTVAEGSIAAGNVLANDTDPDGDTLTVLENAFETANGGLVTVAANGDFTYTPATGYTGSDSFTYAVEDGLGGLSIATVNVTVTAAVANQSPQAQADSFTGVFGSAITGNVLTNDTDPDSDALSVVETTVITVNGVTVSLSSSGHFNYNPPADFVGTDSFDYTVSDGHGGTSVATVTLNVALLAGAIGGTLGDDSLVGTGAADTIYGLGGHDVIEGGSGNDHIYGGGGNDTLNGGSGADTLYGGTGNDVYVVDDAGDVVVENASEGTDTVRAGIDYTLGANVENLELTGTANINGSGNSLVNSLTGNSGNNTLDGGAGADTMTGGTGNDTYVVDDAGEVVVENTSEGTDTVRASINYTLGANVENLVLTGAANINGSGNTGNNTLVGNNGDNTLAGELGDDTYVFTSAGGNDVVSEAGGTDTIRFDATVDPQSIVYTRAGDDLVIAYGVGTDTVTVLGFFDENSTNGHIETVVFDEDETFDTYNDIVAAVGAPEAGLTLAGTAGVDTLVGGAGNDTLNGLAGADTLIGAAGNDLYIVDNAGDVVIESAGQGTDTVQSSVTYTLSANVENLTLTGTAAIHGTGNALSNVITGNSGNNSLNGGAGADTLIGGAGSDTYVVDNTADMIVENLSEGNDLVFAGVSYTLSENTERLTLTGTDHISGIGNALANTLIGNSGNNTLDGGAGADRMEGGAGNDVYIVDNTSDTIVENTSSGTDVVYASVDYTIANHIENLILTGTDNINGTGNGLNNTLIGNIGNNTLNGGAGVDTMIGGAGNDSYTIDNISDIVIELADEGEDTVRSSISFTLGDHLEHLILIGGTANLVGIGNNSDNSIVGSTGVNTLIGGAGNDFYGVDHVNDIVIELADEGVDTVRSSVNYTLSANVENLILTGIANLAGTGNAFDNTLTGNSGSNTLDGGAGADTLIGGDDSDRYIVENIGDVIIEAYNEGSDTVLSSVSYTLSANVEYLTLTGSSNINGYGNEINNIVRGNVGNNTLMGYAGHDTLDGGLGADTMIGGEGGDTYIVDDIGDIVIEDGSSSTDTVEASISYTLVENIERLLLTGTANINATGNTLNNSIIGNSGNNTLIGGGGNDRMEGGDGDDLYYVDSEGDSVVENGLLGGIDHVISSISYDLGSYVEKLTLTGTGDFMGVGNNMHNTIIGNSGNNILSGGGGGGSDTLIGGLGNDTYSVDHVNDVIIELENEGIDSVISSISLTLGEHFEHLQLENSALYGIGNAHDNTLRGNNSSNTLIGYGGNDYLDGGPAGTDTMIGGTGDDYYVVSHSYDVVIEEADEGIDTVQTAVHWTLGEHFENLVAGGGTNLTLIGNSANNTIIGSTGNNYIDGGAGVDTMSGGVANDTYFVDNVNDVVIEQAGTAAGTDDTVRASVSYTLSENIENLTLTGTGDLNGTGNSGQNTITGTSGNNTLDGGASYDRMIGGAGDDVYIVDNGGDVIVEQEGGGIDIVFSSVTYTQVGGVENMTLTGSANINGTGNSFANIVIGNSGNNVLNGMSGDDTLFGGEGNDSLNGGLGNDTLYGGAGADTLTGSSNADIFVFDTDSYGSIDIVTDFSTGSGDAIDIRDLLDGYDSGTDDVTEWVRITTSGSNSIVEVDRDGTGTGYGWTQIATLNGVTGLTDEAALVTAGNLLVA